MQLAWAQPCTDQPGLARLLLGVLHFIGVTHASPAELVSAPLCPEVVVQELAGAASVCCRMGLTQDWTPCTLLCFLRSCQRWCAGACAQLAAVTPARSLRQSYRH